jgi:hypothetical protein
MNNPFLEKLDLKWNPIRQTWECGVFATLKKSTITELKTSAVVMGVDPYQLRDRVEQDIASCYMGYGDLVVNNFGHIDYENRL